MDDQLPTELAFHFFVRPGMISLFILVAPLFSLVVGQLRRVVHGEGAGAVSECRDLAVVLDDVTGVVSRQVFNRISVSFIWRCE